MTDNAPVISIWDYQGTVWAKVGEYAYHSFNAEIRHNDESEWSAEGPYDAEMLADRLVTIDWRDERFGTFNVAPTPQRTSDEGTLTLNVGGMNALSLLRGVTIWPDPTVLIGAQPGGATDGYYVEALAPAETVARNLILNHFRDRYGADVTMAASLGRGGNVRVRNHMGDLLETILKKLRRGEIGLRFGLVNTSGTRAEMTATIYVPADLTLQARFSDRIGTLQSWEHGTEPPTATRAIVRGAGDVYRVVERADVAATWGRHYEVFVDATDTFDPAELDERGEEALDEGSPTTTFRLEAAETAGMRWGDHYREGDRAIVELATGVSVTDTISAVQLAVDVDSGPVITPIVGNPDGDVDPDMRTAKLMRRLNRAIRKHETER